MNAFFRSTFFAVTALGAFGSTVADAPKGTPFTVIEFTAGEVVLPSSENGTLVMRTCGKCALKSYPVSASTRYFIAHEPVTLAQLTASVLGQPKAFVGVAYSPKTNAILYLRAVPTRRVAQP
jgi:hypothetical protein